MRRTLLLVWVAAAHGAAVTAQDLAYTGSLQYSTGSYVFTEPTHTLSLYNGVAFSAGRMRLAASLPVIVQNSGAVSVVGGAYLPTGGMENGAVGGRHQGQQVPMGPGGGGHDLVSLAFLEEAPALGDSLAREPGGYTASVGDPLLSAGLEVYHGFGVVRSLELTASAKPPLNGLDSGMGTGEWDYAVGGAAAAAVGPVLAFLDVAWWWYGDLPELELRDGASWGGGLGVPLSGSVWVSAMATLSNRIIDTAEAARSVSAGLTCRVGDAGSVSLLAGAGLSETSPDVTVSIGWRRSLFP